MEGCSVRTACGASCNDPSDGTHMHRELPRCGLDMSGIERRRHCVCATGGQCPAYRLKRGALTRIHQMLLEHGAPFAASRVVGQMSRQLRGERS